MFLSTKYYPSQVASVKFLTRSVTSSKAKQLIAEGAEAIAVDGKPTAESLKGVDVFVNVLGEISEAVKNAYAKAAVEAGVKVYFPSEYGL